MEYENPDQNKDSSLFGLVIDPNSRIHLTETAKWTRFLAIAGFIFIGLMILYGVMMSFVFNNLMDKYQPAFPQTYPANMGIVLVLYMVIFGLIYFFPCLFTLRFSNYMRRALYSNDQE